MSLYLLDSCVVIDILRGRSETVEAVRRLLQGGATLATCDVVVAEIAAGTRASERAATVALLATFEHLGLSYEGALRAGTWKAEYRAKGTTLSLLDCLIAATAVEHPAVLVTDNVARYPYPELSLHRPGGRTVTEVP